MKRMQPYARIVEANNMPLLIPSGPFSRTHSHTPNKAGKVHWDSYRPVWYAVCVCHVCLNY